MTTPLKVAPLLDLKCPCCKREFDNIWQVSSFTITEVSIGIHFYNDYTTIFDTTHNNESSLVFNVRGPVPKRILIKKSIIDNCTTTLESLVGQTISPTTLKDRLNCTDEFFNYNHFHIKKEDDHFAIIICKDSISLGRAGGQTRESVASIATFKIMINYNQL